MKSGVSVVEASLSWPSALASPCLPHRPYSVLLLVFTEYLARARAVGGTEHAPSHGLFVLAAPLCVFCSLDLEDDRQGEL